MRRIFFFSSAMAPGDRRDFGLLLIGMHWLLHPTMQDVISLDPNQLQTVMFLQLRWRHLLLFSVRTKKAIYEPAYRAPAVLGDRRDSGRRRADLPVRDRRRGHSRAAILACGSTACCGSWSSTC